jgi:hypothetical protein
METIYTILIPLLSLVSVIGSDNETVSVPPILDPTTTPSVGPTTTPSVGPTSIVTIPPILDPTGVPSGAPTNIPVTNSEPMWGLFGFLGVVVPILIAVCITKPNLFCDLTRLITCRKRKSDEESYSSNV